MIRVATARLVIRAMTDADAPALAAYRGDPEIARYQGWDLPFTVADADRFVAGLADVRWPVFGGWYQCAIDLGGAMIGDIGVNRAPDGREAAIGYTLAPEHHGQGYATEAVGAIVDVLFAEGVQRVKATVDPRNGVSARVLERVGFGYEGRDVGSEIVRGELVDNDRYVLGVEERRQD